MKNESRGSKKTSNESELWIPRNPTLSNESGFPRNPYYLNEPVVKRNP